jgi:hypothetical protein
MTVMIGFPSWTLWGMGIAALAALFFLFLAFIAQSPRLLRRLGLDVYRLDLRVREFTGYALASLLLVLGFFFAGVPIGGEVAAQPAAPTGTATQEAVADLPLDVPGTLTRSAITDTVTIPTASVTPRNTGQTPISGGFGAGSRPTQAPEMTVTGTVTVTGGATPSIPTLTPTGETGDSGDNGNSPTATGTPTRVTSPTPSLTPTPTETPTPSATPTMTPSPTATPTPSLTPTPIDAPTAIVDPSRSNVWIYRSPGGQELVLAPGGSTVILLPRRSSQGGFLWREVMTVDGLTGWIDDSYIVYGDDS